MQRRAFTLPQQALHARTLASLAFNTPSASSPSPASTISSPSPNSSATSASTSTLSPSHVAGITTIQRSGPADLTAGLKSRAANGYDNGVESPRGMHIAAGFSSSAMWKKKPVYEDPEFEVVNAGLGSVLVARLPPTSRFVSDVGKVLGTSSTVENRLAAHGGIASALSRKITGSNALLQQFWTTAESGDVILAPKRQGDIATIRIDGSSEYCIRRTSFLAATDRILKGSSGVFTYRASGVGTIAITGFGGLYRLVLATNEEYLVPSENLVAWDAALDPSPEMKEVEPAPKTPTPAPIAQSSKKAESVGNKLMQGAFSFGSATLRWLGWVGRFLLWRGKKAIAGDKGLYRLRGPGEFYIASRLEPSFAWLRDACSIRVNLPKRGE
ncbi:hypothetical protein HDU67_004860 [Dinochytrium kinnereticum]|nr:hypothetical protein HDU67_004860 [Dinochytrium kinnereticum]